MGVSFELVLKRISLTPTATWGVLIDRGEPFALTLELPWRENKKNVSCIPAGEYYCSMVIRPNGLKTYEVKNVPNRANILFHAGNTPSDSKGCILIGEEFGVMNQKTSLLSSQRAFQEFMKKMEHTYMFKLKIMEV